MEAAVAGRLRVGRRCRARRAGAASPGRPPAPRRTSTPGRRVEVDAQLVGVLGVVGEVRPHVEAEAAEVHGPQRRARGRPTTSASRRRAVRRADDRASPATSGALSGTRFWKNDLPAAPSGKRCINAGRPPIAAHQRLGDREVVVDEVELRLAALGEEHLVGVGDRDAPSTVDLDEWRRHPSRLSGHAVTQA